PQPFALADVLVEHAGAGDLAELLAGVREAFLDRLPGRAQLVHRQLTVAVGGRELDELLLGLLHLRQPALGIGRFALPPLERPLQRGRVEPDQDSLGHEGLDLVGVDVGLAAAREAVTLGAGIAALAGVPRTRNQPLPAMAADEQAAEQVAPAALVRPPFRVGEQRPDLRAVGLADDRGPHRLRDDLAVVHALAADARRGEHPPKALRRPGAAARRRDAALVQITHDRPHRLTRQQPLRALTHDHRLRSPHGDLVGFVAVRPAAATGDAAVDCDLFVLSADPLA